MNDISKNFSDAEEVFEDYAVKPVPEGKRISWSVQGLAWAGTVFCLVMFSVGGTLAAAMDFSTFLTAVFLGTAITFLIGVLTGGIGARTHLTCAFNARFALGVTGGKLFGLVLAISLSGWFGYQCFEFAHSALSTLQMFGFSGGSPAVWTIVGGLLMIVTAIAGINGITLLSTLGVPLLIALSLAAAGITVSQVDASVLRAASASAASGMSLSSGITLLVGGYIVGACITPDLSRFSKTQKDAFVGCFWGRMIVFPLALLLGGFFQYAYGTSDPCEVMFAHCGMGIFVPFVLVVSIWAINHYNLYCAVLGIINVLDGRVKLPQWLLTLIVGGLSTILGALGVMAAVTSFLNLLGILIPPVIAVVLADYYLYNRNSGLYAFENAGRLKNFRPGTCLSALVGIAVGLTCTYGIGLLHVMCSVIPACMVSMLASVASLVICNAVTRSGTADAALNR